MLTKRPTPVLIVVLAGGLCLVSARRLCAERAHEHHRHRQPYSQFHPHAPVVLYSVVEKHFVDVAPLPALAGLDRLHDGVFRGVEVLGGVLVL